MPEKSETEQDSDEDWEQTVYPASEHINQFVPEHYLNSFYSTHNEDVAMGTILFFLPGYVQRIPKAETLLGRSFINYKDSKTNSGSALNSEPKGGCWVRSFLGVSLNSLTNTFRLFRTLFRTLFHLW